MNYGKTEVIRVGRGIKNSVVAVVGNQLKEVERFKYLDVTFGKDNFQETEITERIIKYNNSVMALYPLLKEKSIPRECKTLIYSTILRPILIYDNDSWTLNSQEKSRIQAADMRVLRTIRGVTRRDRMRNERIRWELSERPILETVGEGRLRWYGHVKRIEDTRYPRKMLQWIPEGRRPQGRPRKRWMEGRS